MPPPNDSPTQAYSTCLQLICLDEQKQDEVPVDTSTVSRPTPAAIGPKDLYNVKIAAPKGTQQPL